MKQLPNADDVRAWADKTGAPANSADELVGLLADARHEDVEWKDAFREIGASGVQAEILALESHAIRIGEFQPSMMSGLLQTAEYARESLHIPSGPMAFGSTEDDIERMIALRMQRQQALYRPGKQVQIVLLESALRVRLTSAGTLRGQLDRLIAVAGLTSLDLRIIPFETALPVFPLSGFRIYDEDLVIVESVHREEPISDADEVANYIQFFDLLRGVSCRGDDALRLIRRSLELLTNDDAQES